MNIPAILFILVFIAFAIYIGLIPSVSDSYRTVKNKGIYHGFFAVESVLVLLQIRYHLEDKFLIGLYAFSALFLWGVSLVPQFWRDDQKIFHPIFTYFAIILGLTATTYILWPHWYFWIPAAALFGGAFLLRRVKNSTLWTEYWDVICTFVPLLFI